MATTRLDGPQGAAWGQSSVTVGATPIVQDNFDDNKKGNMWKTFADDSNCRVQEANKRLEFIAKPVADKSIFAGYVADKWIVDPNHDFAMRVDLNYDLVTMNGGWFTFGVTPSPNEPRKQYVSVGIGCVSVYPDFRREYKDGYEIRWDFEGRGRTRTTLYFSYDSANDIVYLSDSGYGPENAWQTLPDVIRARWPRKPLYVFLGGSAENVQIDAGHAFADNFALDSGVTTNPSVPSNPNTPTDPNTKPTEVTAQALILPSVIKRQGPAEAISAFLSLPTGLLPADVDESQPFVLLPGGAQATRQTTFMWLSGQVVIFASFDRTKLLQTVTTAGETTVQVMGQLKDGRHFGGSNKIVIY
jgi:hypothetical protein